MTNLKIKFCGVSFSNPLILPSGIITEIPEHAKAVEAGVGGITTKSLTVELREGHPQPRIVKFEHGYLNSVGLRNPGIIEGTEQIAQLLKKVKVPVIVSLFATDIKDFQKLVSAIVPLRPSFIELNLSCPNVTSEFGKPLGMGKESTFKVVKAAKKIAQKIPIITKLTPNVPDISEIAKACEQAGSNAISAINTAGPGMVIDIKTKKPILGNKKGGVSGPAIKPITIRCVYDIYEAVKIPIIGIGGISSWEDAVEVMMAGATLVGVGSAMYSKGIGIYKEINNGLKKYLRANKYHSLKNIVGLAHK
jgi:dihydroorotate dehydrogenase (NAD+) catalytic subunit